MKKSIFAVTAVLAYIGTVIGIFRIQKPNLSNVFPNVELTDEGNVILVENGDYGSRLYEIDASGTMVRAYGPTAAVSSFKTTPDGGLLLIHQKEGAGTSRITVNQIDDEWKREKTVGSLDYGNQLCITSSSVAAGRLYLTALDRVEWEVILYSCDLTGQGMAPLTEEMRRTLPAGHKVVSAAFDGKRLYVLQSNGALGFFTGESYRFFPQETAGRVMWMEISSGGLLYTTGEEDSLWFLEQGESRSLCNIKASGLLGADCLKGGSQAVALVRSRDYSHTLTDCEKKTGMDCSQIGYGWPVLWDVGWKAAALWSVLYLFTALCLFCFLYRKQKFRPVIRTMMGSVVAVNMMFIVLLTIYIYRHSRGYLEESRGISNQVFGTMETVELMYDRGVRLDHVSGLDFYDTEWADAVDGTLVGVLVKDQDKIIEFSSELVYADGEHACVLNGEDCVSGRSLYACHGRDTLELLKEAQENGEASGVCSFQGRRYQVYINKAEGKNLYFIRKATLYDLEERSREMWGSSLKWACIYGVISTVLNLLILYHFIRPVKTAAYYMKRVAGGMYDLPEKKFPDNEYGRIWVALHRMCKALQAQEYSRGNVVKYYARFAPDGFESLFGKETLEQVPVGESVSVQATAGVVSVAEKEVILQSSGAGEYIRYLNSLLECVGRCNEMAGGVLLTGHMLESVNVIYKEPELTAAQAVRFAVTGILRLRERADQRYPIRPLVLLHSGACICGLAGSAARTCPFVISRDLELLSAYMDDLKGLGVHVVITEETKERLDGYGQIRYLGFVKPSSERCFALYEVLEACETTEREQKAETAEAFREAVDRYERGMFREAVDGFMELVKSCPKDPAARWYLFACEEKMTETIHAGEMLYGLFQ